MKDLANSIKTILNERISSPFYGSFIITWLLWNWKIPYVTFFINSSALKINKIDYILSNCNDLHYLITYPIVSTILIIGIVPFITNTAYWITLLFDQWRLNKKIGVEKKQLLTLEQSLQIRAEMQSSEEKYEKLLQNKDVEIERLKKHIEALKEFTPSIDDVKSNEYEEFKELLKNDSVIKHLESIVNHANRGWTIDSEIPSSVLNILVASDIITSKGSSRYDLTQKGKRFYSASLSNKP